MTYKEDPNVKIFEDSLTKGYFCGDEENANADEWFGLLEYDALYAVDYNYCVDDGEDCSAFYGCFLNPNTGYIETDSSCFSETYAVNFDDPEWKDKLFQAAYEFLINDVINGDRYEDISG